MGQDTSNIYLVDNSDVYITSPHYKRATINDVVKYCKDKQRLGVDTETEGFDFTCKKMIMFQIGDEHAQFVIDTRIVSIEPLRALLESRDIIKIFHNAKFDYKFIKKWASSSRTSVINIKLRRMFFNNNTNIAWKNISKCY